MQRPITPGKTEGEGVFGPVDPGEVNGRRDGG